MKLVNQKVYIVKAGDTLSEIANHFCGNPIMRFKIADDNNISDANLIHPEQRIVIREEFLKEEFKSQKTDVNDYPLREEEVVQFTLGGVCFRPKFRSTSLPNGYFRIRSVVSQESILVEDYRGQLYYFHLNSHRELIRVMGAIELSPGNFRSLDTAIIVPREFS